MIESAAESEIGPMPRRLRYYANFDLVILDEFGFDRIERTESPQAASLLYKLINARAAHPRRW